MRFVPTRIHALVDYGVGVVLLALPFVLGVSGAQRWALVALGLAAITYSLLTDYELGALRVLSVPAHLALDVLFGVAMLTSPWLFGFSNAPLWPHYLFGLTSLVLAAITHTRARAAY